MSKRNTRSIAIILLAICIISLCGCDMNLRMTPYPLDHVMAVTQTSHAYPGGNAAEFDSRSEILETDEYGRVLFAFNSGFGGYSIGIRQKNDEENVYYYDNVSFLVGLTKYKEYDPEDLELLKEENDWNKPLNEEKMVKRRLVNKYGLYKNIEPVLDQKDLQKVFHASIADGEKVWTYVYLCDENPTGQQLFYVERRINTSTTGDYEYEEFDKYLMILNADGSCDSSNYLCKIDDWDHIKIILAEIKENNGWVG